MGEIVGLCIGSYEFLSRKNTFGDLLSIFSQDDLTIEEVFDKESTLLQMKIPLDEYESNELPLNYLEIYNDMFANTYKEGGVYENALLSIL